MGRIICVSNRVQTPDIKSVGGLASGVQAAMRGRKSIWFGWSGAVAAAGENRKARRCSHNGVSFLTIPLTEKEHDGFYKKMANEVLWPFMHGLGAHVARQESAFSCYLDVNRLFARHLLRIIQPGDIVWVHDYHLIPLGQELRALGIVNRIVFFSHIPFPAPEFVNGADVSDALRDIYCSLIGSLSAYDDVALQTFRDYRHLTSYIGIRRSLKNRFSFGSPSFGPRKTRLGVFPISIETADLEKRDRSVISGKTREMQKIFGSHKIIMAADRLDYTKGLPQRIDGIAHFLESYPEYREKMKYVQIAPLSRADIRQYKATIEKVRGAVSAVSLRFGSTTWNPVHYSEKPVSRNDLLNCFQHTHVGLITPLIDGQNLVAKEFIAAQDLHDPGVLVLSRFAGAAEELGDIGAALLVDPHDPAAVGRSIHAALAMPLEQRRDIHRKGMDYLRIHDVNHWARSLLES